MVDSALSKLLHFDCTKNGGNKLRSRLYSDSGRGEGVMPANGNVGKAKSIMCLHVILEKASYAAQLLLFVGLIGWASTDTPSD